MKDLNSTLLAVLYQGIEALKLSLDENQLNNLIAFVQILLKWNKAYNLTAIVDPQKIVTHHILDSLSVVPYIKGPRVIDVGTGAGLPGIPCALALPDYYFMLLDSNGKKTRFITQVIGELKIKNAAVIKTRVENYKPQQCFNNVTARAFSSLENIIALTHHLSCPDGELLLMKGIYPQAELQKINNRAKVYKLSVPGLYEERHLVCIKGLFNE